MSTTKIEWADETINPLVGCSRISPACDHCYAIGMAHRHGGNAKLPQYHGLTRMTDHGPDWTGEVRWVPGVLEKSLLRLMSVQRNLRIFIGSMTDIAHEKATVQHLANVLAFAAALPQHTIMLLTKRPELLRERMDALHGTGFADVWDAARKPLYDACNAQARALAKRNGNSSTPRERDMSYKAEYIGMTCAEPTWPLRNVWLGATIWDQASLDRALPLLLETPAALRFLSIEPMLGPVDLWPGLDSSWRRCRTCGAEALALMDSPECDCADPNYAEPGEPVADWVSLPALDWVICGGETGAKARPMHPDWPRKLRDDCVAAGVPFMFKQWGEWSEFCWPSDRAKTESRIVPKGNGSGIKVFHVGKAKAGRVLDGRTWEEVPNV